MLVSTIELGEFKYFFKQALTPLCISSNGGVCSNVITKVRKKPLCFTKLIFKAKGQLISKCLFSVFNSSKNQTKQFNLRYYVGQILTFVFWGE